MADTPIWQEPVRGGYPDPRAFGLSGLEQLQSFFRGLAARPPIHYLMGTTPTEFGPGSAIFTMPATGWLVAPPGLVHPGVLPILADGSLGCAVQTSLPPMTPYTTAEISMNYMRPVLPDGGTLTAKGRLIHSGRTLALSDVLIEDGRGRPVAHGTSRCLIFPPIGEPPDEPPMLDPVKEPEFETPDPYLRTPVAGGPVPQEAWDRMSGLEILRAHLEGELPGPPLSYLTGLRPVEAEEGTAVFVLPASGWLTSPLGTVQGGVTGLLADTVIDSAVQTTIPAGTSYAPLDLKVNYLRPVRPDGRDLTGRGTIVHRGKTMAVATAEITDGDGKRVAVATGTSMILPGRPWQMDRPVIAEDEAAGED